MRRQTVEGLRAIDGGEGERARRGDAIGNLDTQRAQLDLELLDQAVEHRLEVAAHVEALGIVPADPLDRAGDDPRGLDAVERLRVQQGPVGEPGGDQTLQIVVRRVAILRDSAPIFQRYVRAIEGSWSIY